jgi:iron-sulfur cluster repair protein YtfE (RIC family)
MSDLATRTGLPDALRVLVEELPREVWESHANFDALTRFWLDRHLMFRKVLGQLLDGNRAYLDAAADPRRYAQETSHYAGFLLNQLHGHHQIEDHHYFPQLQGLDPRLEKGFALLDSDHHALDGHIQGLADTTNGFLQGFGQAEERDRAARLGTALGQFETFLDRHLVDEEELVVPVILTYAPALH